jgi:hypothetical protein
MKAQLINLTSEGFFIKVQGQPLYFLYADGVRVATVRKTVETGTPIEFEIHNVDGGVLIKIDYHAVPSTVENRELIGLPKSIKGIAYVVSPDVAEIAWAHGRTDVVVANTTRDEYGSLVCDSFQINPYKEVS